MLQSSIWITDPTTRCVWITFLLSADPEGYVPGAIPGIAHAANVSLEDAERAIALLLAPDPYSRSTEHEGRRIETVPRGWRILGFVEARKRAVAESEKSRKREWARTNRKRLAANDNADPEMGDTIVSSMPVATSSETVDATKTKTKTKTLSSEGEIPPTPHGVFDAPVQPLVLREIPEGLSFEHLRPEAVAAGVTPADFDRRLADLRKGPIGGQRGVFAHKLDDYVRGFFGNWKTWGETERVKAQRDAVAPPGRAFGGGVGGNQGGPTGARYTGWGRNPDVRHRELAEKLKLDVYGELRDFISSGAADLVTHAEADKLFAAHLKRRATEKRQRGVA